MARVPRVLFHLLDMADEAITRLVLMATHARPELFLRVVRNSAVVPHSLETFRAHVKLPKIGKPHICRYLDVQVRTLQNRRQLPPE